MALIATKADRVLWWIDIVFLILNPALYLTFNSKCIIQE